MEKNKIIQRQMAQYAMRLAKSFPVVAILGPRQSGKTTFAQMQFPNYAYVNLELLAERKLALEDPEEFMRQHPAPLIIDEVQRVPELLSHIQVMVDRKKKMGQFIITGSHQPELRNGLAQSLAGRVGIASLFPLSIHELEQAGIVLDRDDYIFRGFMPRIHGEDIEPGLLYANYYQTYVERDVRQLIQISRQHEFELFVKLLAGRVGQLVNLHSMCGEVGVSLPTLSAWLAVLESSFIVFRLPSWHQNIGKRLVKMPKIYFTDVGLACFLLGMRSVEQVARDGILGGLFENMVVLELLKTCHNVGISPDMYFMRDSKGFEIDILLQRGRSFIPIEVKAARTYSRSFSDSLVTVCKILPGAQKPRVLYAGEMTPTIQGVEFVNFKQTASLVP